MSKDAEQGGRDNADMVGTFLAVPTMSAVD